MTIKRFEDVCIIGAGPTGLVLSAILSNYGIYHTLVDRRVQPTNHPQAHFLNVRTMEILRDFCEPVHRKLISLSPPAVKWRFVIVFYIIAL